MKTYGLVGFPLSHSFSGGYFKKKFYEENIRDAEYRIFPLNDISEFRGFIKNNPTLRGLNVTIPYKESVISFLDKLDETASSIGAVNCIMIDHNRTLSGYNTDMLGFGNSLKKYLKPYHSKALVLGNGGASKAVQQVLKNFSIDFNIVSRKQGPFNLQYSDLDDLIMEAYTLIINATPSGMFPGVNECPPLPYQHLNKKHLLFDLIYNPAETLFMKKGKEKNAVVVNGLEMLHLQAEESWRIWNS